MIQVLAYYTAGEDIRHLHLVCDAIPPARGRETNWLFSVQLQFNEQRATFTDAEICPVCKRAFIERVSMLHLSFYSRDSEDYQSLYADRTHFG